MKTFKGNVYSSDEELLLKDTTIRIRRSKGMDCVGEILVPKGKSIDLNEHNKLNVSKSDGFMEAIYPLTQTDNCILFLNVPPSFRK